MDLPTYTNIWRLERRLYKLYDFRLPMPLSVNWIAVFVGITIPYIVLLIAIGLPFNHNLVWLYVLPPGILTWLCTRPVIENKRLPELVESQARYLSEPRTWVRLAPLSEKDEIVLSARVWRSNRPAKRAAAPAARRAPANRPALPVAQPGRQVGTLRPEPVLKPTSVFRPEPAPAAGPVTEDRPVRQRPGAGAPQRTRAQERSRGQERARGRGRARSAQRSRPPLLGQGQAPDPARRAPALPPGRQFPTPGPVAMPPPAVPEQPLARPVHVIPRVVPPAAALPPPPAAAPPRPALADQPAAPSQPAAARSQPTPNQPAASQSAASQSVAAKPAAQSQSGPAQPAPAQPSAAQRPAPPVPMPVPAPVVLPEPPAAPDQVPGRARANGPGSQNLEVSHDAPRRRRFAAKAKPAAPAQSAPPEQPAAPRPSARLTSAAPQTPSANPARDWPVTARPLRPVPPPVDEGPEHAAPAPATPAPAFESPAAATPVTETPSFESPVGAPVFEAPAAEATAVKVPVVVEAPLVESPVAEAPVVEAPVAAAPADEPPAVAAPVTATAKSPVPELAQQPQPPKHQEAIHVEAAPAPPVPAPPPAPVPASAVQEVTDSKRTAIPSIERALSGPSRDRAGTGSWGGKVKVVTGNGAAQGPGARDQEAQDRNRARLPIIEPRRILVLGCTSGAGQSVTALMTASMLASLREHPVAAVDLHDGTLARYRAPAAWLEELMAGKPPQAITPARPDGLHPTPKPSLARLDVVASHEPLKDGDEIKLAVQLNRHYPLTLLDPGAAGLTRLLKVTDQLVVVVPANVDAAGALADTRDWLDNNGHADLAMQSVTVINGVSRRSLPDVENAETIARGRSRAIVRVPWDDMLPVAAANPSTLRPQTRVAYTALAGVLVAGLAATPVRKKS